MAATDPGALARRRRLAWFVLVAAAITLLDLLAAWWAERYLLDWSVPLGLLDLQLGHNPGVAFGLASSAPAWLVVLVTGVLTVGLALLGWRLSRRSAWAGVAVGVVTGGALGNLLDRAADGVVTDYLHSGWWPTFNLADVAIVTGAVLLVLLELRTPGSSR